MSQGFYPGNLEQKYRINMPVAGGSQDPSVTATASQKGTLFVRYGTTQIWQKQDNGLTTNWAPVPLGAIVGTPYAVAYYDNLGILNAGIANFSFKPAGPSGQLVLGGANTVNAAAQQVFVLGDGNNLSASALAVLVVGPSNIISSDQGLVVGSNNDYQSGSNNIIFGDSNIGNLNFCMLGGQGNTITAAINSSVVVGQTNTIAAGSGRALIAGTGNFHTFVENCMVVGNSHVLGAATRNSVIGGQSLTTAAELNNSGFFGLGVAGGAAGVVVQSVISGETHTINGPITDSILSGNGSTFDAASDTAQSIICAGSSGFNAQFYYGAVIGTGHNFDPLSVTQRSLIFGQSFTNQGNTNRSILGGVGNVVGVGATLDLSIFGGGNYTVTGTVAGCILFANAGAMTSGISSIIGGASISETGVTGLYYSIVVGNTIQTTDMESSAIFGRDHIAASLAGVLLSGQWHEPGRANQALVGQFYPTGDTNALFGVGIGTSNVARARGFSVESTGLVRREAGGLRVKTRNDGGAAVTIDASTDYFVLGSNAGPTTFTLPAGVDGMEFKIVVPSTAANGTLAPNGADTVDSSTTVTAGTMVTIIFLGGVWYRN